MKTKSPKDQPWEAGNPFPNGCTPLHNFAEEPPQVPLHNFPPIPPNQRHTPMFNFYRGGK